MPEPEPPVCLVCGGDVARTYFLFLHSAEACIMRCHWCHTSLNNQRHEAARTRSRIDDDKARLKESRL